MKREKRERERQSEMINKNEINNICQKADTQINKLETIYKNGQSGNNYDKQAIHV